MKNPIADTSVAYLLSLETGGAFNCSNSHSPAPLPFAGIAGTAMPDHDLCVTIPRKLVATVGCKELIVHTHLLWVYEDTPAQFRGLVVDKADLTVYHATVKPAQDDGCGFCLFQTVTIQEIRDLAKKINPFLTTIADLAERRSQELLDFQLYSPFSDHFCYMEVRFEDRMILCGVGLNKNNLMAVGWLGKLILKDLYISYAECSFSAYAQLKAKLPSLYERCRKAEENKAFFSLYQTTQEKRKHLPKLLELLTTKPAEPFSLRQAEFFCASPSAKVVETYSGPAHRWMEDFLLEYIKTIRNKKITG